MMLLTHRSPALALAIVFGAVAGACGNPGRPALADADKQPFVDAHNAVRAGAAPAPVPALAPLAWSDDDARVAQAWSERCVFEHSHGALGENLAFFSGPDGADGSTPPDVVTLWGDEAPSYDYATNACAAGAQCGHYTQIVWRGTTSFGCGAAKCTIDGGAGTYWVCNYDPPGNVVGEKPY